MFSETRELAGFPRRMRRWSCLLLLAGALGGGVGGHTQTLATAAPPAYPLAAKAAGREGQVTLKGVIGKNGTLRDLKVLKGPDEFRPAALEAVAHWQYHPYRHFGRLVEVETTITVNFTMGNKKEKAIAQAEAQAELAKATPAQTSAGVCAPK